MKRVRRLLLIGLVSFGALNIVAFAATYALGPPGPRSAAAGSRSTEHGRLRALDVSTAESRIDPRLTHVVSVLAGVGAEVRCWSRADWKRRTSELERRWGVVLGPWRAYTSPDRSAVHLSPEVCAKLTQLAEDRKPILRAQPVDALSWSLETLAHEAQHVSGVGNEALAQCYGVQSTARAARLLGRSASEGRYLATVYWKRWYVWFPPRYRARECRNGGRLDLHPDSDLWP